MNLLKLWLSLLSASLSRKTIQDPLSRDISSSSITNLHHLKPYLSRHWKRILLGIFIVILASLSAFPGPLVNRFLVDNVILSKQLDLLLWVILALVGLKILTTAAGMAQSLIFNRLQMDIMLDLQKDLVAHTLSLPKSFFDDKEVGYLMSRVNSDTQGLTWFFSQVSANILSNLLRFMGGVVFLFLLEWRLAIISLLVLPVLVLTVQFFSRRISVLSHHRMEQNANVITRFQETISSIPLIKAFSTEHKETQRVLDQVKASQQVTLEQSVLGSMISTILTLVPDLARLVVLVGGAYWIIIGDWTLGSLLAFLGYMGYVFGPAIILANINLELQNALASLDRVSTVLKITPENTEKGLKIGHLKGAVRFEKVFFAYDSKENILQDINIEVHPGEHIAIIGPSGVGKTTLISLLLRFYKPTRGRILYDDREADEFDLYSLRQRIGYVSQSILLMEGSIRENLSYGNQEASSQELEHAARVAGIYDFISSLPEGLDAHVGEKGVNLSEGQKQRLSIARALVKDPDILILDEPTSALDSLVEKSIFDSLPVEVHGKTLFIVAHRLSTIQKADRILVLKDKRLVGFGNHDELMAGNEYYRSLFA